MKEIWKDAVGYEEFYMISNLGNVFSKRTNRVVVPSITQNGYATIATRFGGRKGKAVLIRIHRMVGEAFIQNTENKPFINHKDGNKRNNTFTNLEWCTQKENVIHAEKSGLTNHQSGGDSKIALLSWEQAREIRETYKNGNITYKELGTIYGVSHKTIEGLMNNRHYVE